MTKHTHSGWTSKLSGPWNVALKKLEESSIVRCWYINRQLFHFVCHNARVWQTGRQTDRQTDRQKELACNIVRCALTTIAIALQSVLLLIVPTGWWQCVLRVRFHNKYINNIYYKQIITLNLLINKSTGRAQTSAKANSAGIRRPDRITTIITILIFIPSGVKIPRVKNKAKNKTKSWSGHYNNYYN